MDRVEPAHGGSSGRSMTLAPVRIAISEAVVEPASVSVRGRRRAQRLKSPPSKVLSSSSARRAAPRAVVSAPPRQAPADGATIATPAVSHFGDLMKDAPVAAFVKDADGLYVFANPHLLATMRRYMGPDWYGKTDADLWPPEAAAALRGHDTAVLRTGGLEVFTYVTPLADGAHSALFVEFPLSVGDGSLGVGGVALDITEFVQGAADRNRLGLAVEQVAESVMITDRAARITYVNAAFERVTGYSRAEVLGQNPRVLSSGLQPASFYAAMWDALGAGLPWAADFVNRRKDGSLFFEEAMISPIRDGSGHVTSYIAVKRDVTSMRELAERSTGLERVRALVGEAIRSMRPGDAVEATAQRICRQVARLTDIAAAQLLLFEGGDRAVPVGLVVNGRPDPLLEPPSFQRSRQLRNRAEEGPWVEPWTNLRRRSADQLFPGPGFTSFAYAPIRSDGRLVGLLAIQATDAVHKTAAAEALPALIEFADLAGALIGRDVAARSKVGRSRDHVQGIISGRAFAPVFQPIVDLVTRETVGYEALTRFTDGANPETLFAEAAAVGLGLELETVTLKAAIREAESLPRSAWLNINASPDLVMAGEPLRSILAGNRRRLVLEVTEHSAIADYPAFLSAMTKLGPKVQLAVDDAGVGFASLRHILELNPAFVKLDRWLITDLESDRARQAMIVGLCHFALSTGCRLIAEGIETENELTTLRLFSVELGQGYLLGRPGPVSAVPPQP